MMDALSASKSMRAVYLSIGLGVTLVAVGIAVYVIFDKEVTELIAIGLGKLGIDSGTATYRSVKVDAPVRHAYAQLEIEKQARAANVATPVVPTLERPSKAAEDPYERGSQ